MKTEYKYSDLVGEVSELAKEIRDYNDKEKLTFYEALQIAVKIE